MNTKCSPPIRSRQASVIPYTNTSQRNGCISYETSSTVVKPLQKKTSFLLLNDNSDSLEMQIYSSQLKTLEAFYELEHLIPNGVPNRASIVEMRSIIQDQEESVAEKPSENNSTLT